MNIIYCRSCSSEPKGILDEETAKERHNEKRSYMALIQTKFNLQYLVILNNQNVSIHVRDNEFNLLRYWTYLVKDDILFLETIVFYEFDDKVKNRIKTSFIYRFKENSTVIMVVVDERTDNLVRDEKIKIDVKENWFKCPVFGDYEELYSLNIQEFARKFDKDLDEYK